MKNGLQILKNKIFIKIHKYPSPNASNFKYFWTLSYNHQGILGITKLSSLTSRKRYAQKTSGCGTGISVYLVNIQFFKVKLVRSSELKGTRVKGRLLVSLNLLFNYVYCKRLCQSFVSSQVSCLSFTKSDFYNVFLKMEDLFQRRTFGQTG